MDENLLRNMAYILLGAMGVALALSAIFIAATWYQVKNMRLRPGMGLVETLRAVPITLVIGLDLLDFALDVFSAPISWLLLSRLNLQGLRTMTVLESLLPFTQAIPTLTLAWLAVRVLNLGEDDPRLAWIEQRGRDMGSQRVVDP